jgi:hypothetical protein
MGLRQKQRFAVPRLNFSNQALNMSWTFEARALSLEPCARAGSPRGRGAGTFDTPREFRHRRQIGKGGLTTKLHLIWRAEV